MNVDDTLIQRVYSPLSGWFQHRLGVGQWRLAMECLNGHVALYLGAVAFAVGGKGVHDGIFIDLLAAFVWLTIMDFVRRHAARQSASSLGMQTARLSERAFRYILIVMLSVSLCYVRGWSSAFYALSLLLLVSHLYFKACDTPPPRPRRSFAFNSA